MTINEACKFFENIPKIHRKLQTIVDVGLGYVKLRTISNYFVWWGSTKNEVGF